MLELLNGQPMVWIVLAAVLGLLVGSFLNVVIHRLPKMMEAEWTEQCAALNEAETLVEPPRARYNLMTPRSACPHCQHAISALENIPVLSWLLLGGKCSNCKIRISPRYALVEVLTALLSAAVAWKFGWSWQTCGGLLFTWTLLALAFIDLDTTLLPDSLTLPLVWLGLLFNLNANFVDLPHAVIGAMAGYLILWSIYWLFKLATGKEGMGYGDFKLLAALGAWLGWELLPVTIVLSSLVGALAGIAMIVFIKHDRRIPIPFGPYLAGGGLVALFFGSALNHAYLAQF
jgi:leader peptidase (prepilin peptidase)/N-methyltransferase